jgi:hypothetical protein
MFFENIPRTASILLGASTLKAAQAGEGPVGIPPQGQDSGRGWRHDGAIRVDRFVDTDHPLPDHNTLIQSWSYWDLLVEIRRLDEIIGRNNQTQTRR